MCNFGGISTYRENRIRNFKIAAKSLVFSLEISELRSAVEDAASQCRYDALCYSERSHRTGAAKARGILPAEIFCNFSPELLHKMRFGTAKEGKMRFGTAKEGKTEAALPTGTSVGSKISGDAADASPEKARPLPKGEWNDMKRAAR